VKMKGKSRSVENEGWKECRTKGKVRARLRIESETMRVRETAEVRLWQLGYMSDSWNGTTAVGLRKLECEQVYGSGGSKSRTMSLDCNSQASGVGLWKQDYA
jgi:hypothetical protein